MKRIVLFTLLALALLAPALAEGEASAAPAKLKPALLVIDVQNAYLGYVPEQHRQVGMWLVNGAIDLFRKNGYPVIHVYHTDPAQGPPPGSEPFEFPKTVHVQPGDSKVIKNYPSAFKKTELEKILRDQGVNTVFLCGLSAVGCVLYTYFDAQGLDFRTFMIKDGIMSHRPDLTRSVEEITGAVDLDVIAFMLECTQR
jgi:nicotinamidase-related amidase